MTTDYDPIAEQYQLSKQQPWRMYIESYGLLDLAGDLAGKAVVDLACGEGFYSRLLKHGGAQRVLGVDSSQGMIDLARKQEVEQQAGIEYQLSDVREMGHTGEFDLAVAAWLLNYASTTEQLEAMCQAVSGCLKPGGRFVTINSSPLIDWLTIPSYRKYGFEALFGNEMRPGAPITWKFYLENETFDIENYYLSQSAHEEALHGAGFSEINWRPLQVSAEGTAAYEAGYWDTFLTVQPVVFIECVKG
ncbi:Cypemycin methyltransferase [Symmachiella dynata]|uniref:class I SAM-dependent methyltransferase n=1 Tax=Symmachiella dynata TaxID=2527995 RepID=UPI00118BBDDF|nr:class I SAM-dependent methyltransferase [Symmachiella dynata]QDT46586.1 Cypemycin methyltransferase [Symmachiella dynata]